MSKSMFSRGLLANDDDISGLISLGTGYVGRYDSRGVGDVKRSDQEERRVLAVAAGGRRC